VNKGQAEGGGAKGETFGKKGVDAGGKEKSRKQKLYKKKTNRKHAK